MRIRWVWFFPFGVTPLAFPARNTENEDLTPPTALQPETTMFDAGNTVSIDRIIQKEILPQPALGLALPRP